ncbi:hypothetical protein ACGFYU_09560 [Streptomyces sp. NPDC048337]|uniref:hypothetical protein n=1 Tax=Streptomyces sp. NPDC048337 TaxID=3365535 RepID=UPI003715EDCB
MATLAVVHDAEPAIRRPHDIIAPPGGRTGHRTVRKGPVARAKWLTASVREDAETVIAAAFGQAEARDPEHHRTWVVLIDGATHQRGGYAAALRREVEQRTSDSKDGTIRTKVFGVGADAGRRENREVVSRYLEVAEPISVIGLVMDVLEEKDVIVHVDLVQQTVLRNKALTKALAAAPEARPVRPGRARRDIRLRDVEDFVLIRGRFRKIDDTLSGTVFLAPYGDPEDPARGPRVRVTCATEGLRNEVPRGPFSARCLGKVQDWNAEEGRWRCRPWPSSAEPGAAGTPVRGAAVPGRRRAGRRAPC